MQKRIRYLEAQLAVLAHDPDDDVSRRRRAQLSSELDHSRTELAQYVTGVGMLR